MTSTVDSLHLCISCLQVCKVFIEEVLAQKPCMYGNKFRLNLCIRFITHSGSIGHKNRKRKYKNEALKNSNIRLWQIFSWFLVNFNTLYCNRGFLSVFNLTGLIFIFLIVVFCQKHSDWFWNSRFIVSELVVGFGEQDKKEQMRQGKII